MSHLEMVSVVLVISQYAKEVIRRWIPVEGFVSILLAGVVSAGVVGYKFVTEGLPFELAAFFSTVIAVTAEAALGKMAVKPAFKGLKGTIFKKGLKKIAKDLKEDE